MTELNPHLIKACTESLGNPHLINLILPLIFQRANIYDQKCLIGSINFINTCLFAVTDSLTLMFPHCFNYLYFFKALKLILEGNNSYAIAKVLILLFNFYEKFEESFKNEMTLYLLGKIYTSLFCHWSYNVRIIYYNLILIKINYGKIEKLNKKSKSNTNRLLTMNT